MTAKTQPPTTTMLADLPAVLDISMDDYNALPALRSGDIKAARRSMRYFHAHKDGQLPQQESSAFAFGQLFEDLLCGRETKYQVLDPAARPEPTKTMASKANREWKADLIASCEYILPVSGQESAEALIGMIESMQSHEVMHLVRSSQQQQSFVFRMDGQVLKARPDFVLPKKGVIADLKTARSADPGEFARQAARLDYPIQAAIQCMGFRECYGEMPQHYLYVVAEKEPPYHAEVYELPLADVRVAMDEVHFRCEQITRCEEKNDWPGYTSGDQPMMMDLPGWYMA